ncbi:MATE family efflux transporter [Mollicutes bacterium LVI A0039]|nr:MATE family efflux transporter [Mollicutes bacterium LVI A0039]
MLNERHRLKEYIKFIYPLCLFSFLQQIYGIIDIANGSLLGANEMSYIVYIDQVMLIIMAFANSIAVALSILISKRVELDKNEEIKLIIGNTFIVLLVVSVTIASFITLFDQTFLTMIFAPAEFYDIDKTYLVIRSINNIFLFFNLSILAIEKAKGNTQKVFIVNIVGILVKVITSAIISNVFEMNLAFIGIITIIPTLFVFLISLRIFLASANPYTIGIADYRLNFKVLRELFDFSIPLFFSLVVFNVGKAVVNIQALKYGADAVGYLGTSNRIIGLTASLSNGLQEGVSILLARYRTTDWLMSRFIIKTTLLSNILITVLGACLYVVFFDNLTMYFAAGNVDVANKISMIFKLELIGFIFLPLTNFIVGILYGFEKTKLVFIISFFRIFIFRNLVLVALSFTSVGISALGIAMLTSHVGTFGLALYLVCREFKLLKN